MGARDIAADAQQSEFECSSRGSREELGAGGAAAAQAKVAKRGGGSEAHCGAASGASGAASGGDGKAEGAGSKGGAVER